ncbi:MAG TPA: YraN family protein [Povalibacter sp.]|nr:YraN family protein [Povalibacter sp.]
MDGQYRKEAGVAGENAALIYLRGRGLKLIAQNYRCKAGEIDLAMLDGTTLALIEVRYRADASFGGAAASVIWRKQRRIVNAARHLLQARVELRRYPARFDVVAVSPGEHGLQIEWIKHAFTL